MPAARLTPAEAARVAEGVCACGCGQELPRTRMDYWRGGAPTVAPGTAYFQESCRAVAYRLRRKEGRVVTAAGRQRAKLLREAAALQDLIDLHQRTIDGAQAEIDRLTAARIQLEQTAAAL